MKFRELGIGGVWLIEPELVTDERGGFARIFCRDEFAAHGLPTAFVQSSISYNRHRHTLRGMHLQRAPHAETKLVRCTAGAILDVVVDLRRDSPTFGRWLGVELSAANRHSLCVPKGLAHGFLTLTVDAELHYSMDVPHAPGAAAGFRWNDPAFAIQWPAAPAMISPRDAAYPDFDPAAAR
jgi:dTDP-4-dehydrorhamnose 3,5-epimerase